MRKSNFKKLLVWEKSFLLCPKIYRLTKTFPKHEQIGLSSQMQRAAISIPSNIAEGHARSSDADFARFLYISLGSLQELETMILLSKELEYISDCTEWIQPIEELNKMISALITRLKGST